MQISPIDFAIIAVYLAGITAFGARFRRGQKTLRDYFLGGRTTPWWALACSIVATETSTLTIIGTPAIAFAGNLGFLQLVLGYLAARVVLCVVLVPQYFQGEFYTAYQLLGKRFGGRMKSAAAVVFTGDANAGGGGADLGDRQGGERRFRDGRAVVDCDRDRADDVLHV
jgi:Na+/proline symporter